jgi:uncharacterized protein with FMN-binding domain
MRKAIVVVVAVAILGALAVFNSKHSPASSPAPQTGQSAGVVQGSNSADTTASSMPASYKDGTYTGMAIENPYGIVQVAAVISGGKITDINFVQMPGPEQHSKEVTAFSESPLKQSALSKQSASIDFVSGATDTSLSFKDSLQAALNQAAAS